MCVTTCIDPWIKKIWCVVWRQHTCGHQRVFRCADTHLFLNKILLSREHKPLFENIINICMCYARCLKKWNIEIIFNKSENFPKKLKSENLEQIFWKNLKIWKSEKSWNFWKKTENLKNLEDFQKKNLNKSRKLKKYIYIKIENRTFFSQNRSFNFFFGFRRYFFFFKISRKFALSTLSCVKVTFVILSPSTRTPHPKWPSYDLQITLKLPSDDPKWHFWHIFKTKFDFFQTFLRFRFRFWISIFRSRIPDLGFALGFYDFLQIFRFWNVFWDIFWSFQYICIAFERDDP